MTAQNCKIKLDISMYNVLEKLVRVDTETNRTGMINFGSVPFQYSSEILVRHVDFLDIFFLGSY